MLKCTIHPEKISQLSSEQMQSLLISLLQHIDRSFTYNTGPIEMANRILTELLEADLLDVEGTGCGGCTSCSAPIKEKTVRQKPGKVIQFPKKN